MESKKPSNPRMHNPDGIHASEARNEDCVTLRDYFANSAMQGHLASEYGAGIHCTKENQELLAEAFYNIADAMLKQREQ